jgi:hypothetical protein
MVLSGLAALPFATADRAVAAPTRAFRMGTTRWPPDLSLRALGQVESFLRDRADMAAPMILGGVPWDAAAEGAGFSAALMRELAWAAPAGHPKLLSLGALDTMRVGMAPHYATADNQPLPERWQGRAFDDPQVIAAYTAYCLRAAEIARPDWLAIGVEVNILLHAAPDLWPVYVRLHRAVYEAVKDRFPDIGVCFTIAAQHFMGRTDGADADRQWAAMAELMAHSDLAAFSIYPHLQDDAPDPVPDGFYDSLNEFAARAGRPAAISECGVSSETIRYSLFIRIPGSPERQAQAMDALFRFADDGDHRFVVNFTSHDYSPLIAAVPAEHHPLLSLWEHCGILDARGGAKAVTAVWDDWLARPPA